MSIRIAALSDATPISELIQLSLRQHVLPTIAPQAHEMLLNSMSAQSIAKYLNQGYRYHVAESAAGDIIGVIGMKENSHLYHLFVHDDHHGKGLSRQLWETAKEVCIQHGNPGQFTVNSALNAERVYLAFGFQRIDGIRHREGMVDVPMMLHLAEVIRADKCVTF
ncbi:GNAT family N-acetyltransferase [Photobacterium galatheae]|uniref:GCN5 family acetyltransferase n=1 Tax=Photobacterium galatheae TaxID=1654360 RepID=A0A066RR53_9GAMM|nr:GNAT family N-acetyltransferase [Photobacterium galatheae]KDM92834.1 GCN5 family acetyltransferase [Photobacterium galatheae]MCM0148201.1 GNAT family N-acetyltransferase [Photobacterium galatheae]